MIHKFIFVACAILVSLTISAALKSATIFSDNMVLQRNSAIRVWGTAQPGLKITISLNTASVNSEVNADGTWSAILPEFDAGGPYSLIISDGQTKIEFKNVLIGDVWFASGQSNIEHPVRGWEWIPHSAVNNAEKEIADSDFPEIRLFSVQKYPSPVKLNDLVSGKWQIAGPSSVADFSSIGWFFAKELYKKIKVPIGIINCSWGGVPIQSLMSRESLQPYSSVVKIPTIPEKFNQTEWASQITESLEKNRIRRNQISYIANGISEKINSLNFDDSEWNVVDFPTENTHLGNVVWFRKKIELTKSDCSHKLCLSLGFPDRQTQVYLNGTELGFFLYPHPVVIEVPQKLLRSGTNIITMRIGQPFGESKVFGNKEEFYLVNPAGTFSLGLSTGWKVNDKLEPINQTTEMYQNNPTYLYNGMVAPIIPYAIKGFIWYQGEANAGEAVLYEQLFQGLITDWRQRWNKNELPFLFVQTSNIELSHQFENKSDSWCNLREAQKKALLLPNTGMIVSLDMGDPYDVHPKNKQDFAQRLVLQALCKVYNKKVIADGPEFSISEVQKNVVVLITKDSKCNLNVRNPNDLNGFEIAGPDKKYYVAKAWLKKNKIYVSSAFVKNPVSVRYAWSNNPKCSLFNSSGLPTSPFIVSV